ncbi:hypothetical protein DPEC_G00060890 [Dallia pectoralis]|uniref:Uncharacterized protein n=1 Tax=Dallia pectoralis TaxID=75939 RepID=A0ACC2H757_DALPE|nr:hypothetical protein DPEC_G00060890 [Dallia pectoralis]
MSLKEDSVDNLVRTVITNFLQPTKPSQPKTTKQCPPLIKKVEHTSQPLYGLSVLDLKEARKRVLQRLNSLMYVETVETEVKKPRPPSRIPVLQKNATCNGKDLKASLIAQLEEKSCAPTMLGPIQKKRRGYERSDVVMDIYLHSSEPLKAVHGVNMAAKPPLPPIRATVPINDAEKVPLKPVRPEGSPRRLTSRRRVVKRHVPVYAEKLMASLKADLFTVIEELILMQSWEEMDAQALVEKEAKEKLMENIWQQIGNNNLINEDRDLWELITDYQEEEERRMEKMVN